MSLTREIFLFFLSNSAGQCYFIDSTGAVQTAQPGDGKSWLPQAPGNWIDQQIGFGRNMRYWAMNRSYTQPLKFVNDGAKIIRYLLYTKRGSEEQLYFNVNKYNESNDIYESYYKGELDLMNNVDDDPLTGVTLNIMEGGLLKVIKAYENTVFEIPCDGSIPENIEVDMSGLMLNADFAYTIVPNQITGNGTIIPVVFQTKIGSDAGAISADQTKQEFDPANGSTFDTLMATSPNFCFSRDFPVPAFNIKASLKFSGSCTNGCLVAWTSMGNSHALVNTITRGGGGNLLPSGAISAGTIYNVDVTFDLQAGENVFLIFVTSDSLSGFSFSFLQHDINFLFNSQFIDTVTYGIKPFDLLTLILRKISQAAFTYPESRIYTLQSDLLLQHSNLLLTSGMALRKENAAVIKTSLAEFYEAFDAELSACMGNLVSTTAPGEVLFFERLAKVLDSSTVAMNLGEVSKLKIKPAADMFFDVLKIGYPEQKYDEKQGNLEYNTTSQYKAPVKKINKELKKVSPYRGDAYGIEYTRVLVSSSNSTNNKSDNNTFILNVDYSSNKTAQAFANGTEGFYYGSGYFLPDALSGSNRGPRMQYHDISGSGIASSFSITDTLTSGDTLRYNGGNTNVTMVATIKFQFLGNASVHYYNNTNIFGAVRKHKEALPAGTYYATFNMLFKGIVIYSQALTLISGQPNSYTFVNTLSNFPLTTFDNIEFEIVYNSQDPRTPGTTGTGTDADGFLLAFNIQSLVVTISDNTAVPVYGLTKKVYDSSTFPNSQFAYNVEEMTPVRMLQKHSGFIKSVLFNQLDKSLTFQVADKNSTLSTTLNGVTVSDGSNVPIASLEGSPLFYPYYFEFETKVPLTFMEVFSGAANGHIKFSYCGFDFYGFPMDVKVKPALEDAQEWKLLCSPLVDLSTLVDIEYNGINNIELMTYGTAIPHLSPVKFIPLGYNKLAQYNFIHIDQDWFINQVGFWPFKDNYFQKWQTNDTIKLQCITNGLAPVHVSIIDCNGIEKGNFDFTPKTDNAIKAPNTLWEAAYSLSALPEGLYYMVLTAGTGGTVTQFISEGLQVAESWPKTLLFEYSSTRNRQATVFSTGYDPAFRVEGWLDEYTPKAKFATYEDQRADLEMLNAIPYMTSMLNIGDNAGIPPWVIRLVDRIMLLNNVTIDGKGFTREADANWEKVDVPGWPLKYWKMQLRESTAMDAVTLTTVGDLDNNLTVAYNIETDAFGDGAGNSNVLQVTKVNGK